MATTSICLAPGLELVVEDGFDDEDPDTCDGFDRVTAIKEIKLDVATLAGAGCERGLARVLEAMGYACLHDRAALIDRVIVARSGRRRDDDLRPHARRGRGEPHPLRGGTDSPVGPAGRGRAVALCPQMIRAHRRARELISTGSRLAAPPPSASCQAIHSRSMLPAGPTRSPSKGIRIHLATVTLLRARSRTATASNRRNPAGRDQLDDRRAQHRSSARRRRRSASWRQPGSGCAPRTTRRRSIIIPRRCRWSGRRCGCACRRRGVRALLPCALFRRRTSMSRRRRTGRAADRPRRARRRGRGCSDRGRRGSAHASSRCSPARPRACCAAAPARPRADRRRAARWPAVHLVELRGSEDRIIEARRPGARPQGAR